MSEIVKLSKEKEPYNNLEILVVNNEYNEEFTTFCEQLSNHIKIIVDGKQRNDLKIDDIKHLYLPIKENT